MSASPWRDDGSDLLIEAMLGNRLIDISARKMTERGYLTNAVIRFVSVPKREFSKDSNYKTVYRYYITENKKRNELIVKAATSLVQQKFLTLVLFNSIAHGKILYDMLSKNIKCALLSGKDDKKQREKIREMLYAGEIKCIIASKIFDIGVDIPILSALVNAGGGKSSVRTLQRVGRVIRLAKGKSIAAVVDFAEQA
jgi:superfamily II DNA or RNA helicase